MASAVNNSNFFGQLKSALSSVSNFRSARGSMQNSAGMTTRQMEEIELNGHNIEQLAYKIGFGL